ncbi:MAG: DUF2783 domain-containing protein [Steroidobacteraceae bacterium]
MSALRTSRSIGYPDDIYEELVRLHNGRSEEDSARVNARLLLLLINHIGDAGIIREAIRLCQAPERMRQA